MNANNPTDNIRTPRTKKSEGLNIKHQSWNKSTKISLNIVAHNPDSSTLKLEGPQKTHLESRLEFNYIREKKSNFLTKLLNYRIKQFYINQKKKELEILGVEVVKKKKKIDFKKITSKRSVKIKNLINFYKKKNVKVYNYFKVLQLKLKIRSIKFNKLYTRVKNKVSLLNHIIRKCGKVKKLYKYSRSGYINFRLNKLYKYNKFLWLKIINKTIKDKKLKSTKKTFSIKNKNLYLKINALNLLKFSTIQTFSLSFSKLREHYSRDMNFFVKCPKLNIRNTLFKKLYYKKKRNFYFYLLKNYKSLVLKKKYKQRNKFYSKLLTVKLKYQKIKKYWFNYSVFQYLVNYQFMRLVENIYVSNFQKFSINNFLWLNHKSYESYLLKFFFYKKKLLKSKHKKGKTFFFNFRNKKLKTYRTARHTHWKFFTTKTIKKKRYQKFLNFFLKKQNSLFHEVFTFFTFKFRLSYRFWLNFNFLYQTYYFIKNIKKYIFQLPIHYDFWCLMSQYDQYKQTIDNKIELWRDRKLQIKKTFWMQQKKRVPKFLKKQLFLIEGVKNTIQYDFITNYFAILKNLRHKTHTNLFIFKNKYLKLHGFKYNS